LQKGRIFSGVVAKPGVDRPTDSYQVVSLETDIVAPIPQIRLKAEHISIDCAPGKFIRAMKNLGRRKVRNQLGRPQIERRHPLSNCCCFRWMKTRRLPFPQ
jgi:hypothetical protein